MCTFPVKLFPKKSQTQLLKIPTLVLNIKILFSVGMTYYIGIML